MSKIDGTPLFLLSGNEALEFSHCLYERMGASRFQKGFDPRDFPSQLVGSQMEFRVKFLPEREDVVSVWVRPSDYKAWVMSQEQVVYRASMERFWKGLPKLIWLALKSAALTGVLCVVIVICINFFHPTHHFNLVHDFFSLVYAFSWGAGAILVSFGAVMLKQIIKNRRVLKTG